MKTILRFLPALFIGLSTISFAQKGTKSNMNIKHIAYPKLDIASMAKTYSVGFESAELQTINTILNSCTADDLKALKVPNSSGIAGGQSEVVSGYFDFPYLQKEKELGEMMFELSFGDFKLNSKAIKTKKISTVVNGEKVKVPAYYYLVNYNVPLTLNVILNDKIIHSKNLGENAIENKIGYDKNYTAQTDLDSYYDTNRADIERALAITATIISTHEARTALENECFYVETETRDMIYSAKGKKLDYSSLEKAATEAKNAIVAIDFYSKGIKTSDPLASSIKTWETELIAIDMSDKKARINKKIGGGLNYNLARAYFYLNDFEKALSHADQAIILLDGDKKIENIKEKMIAQKTNFEGLTGEINKAAVIEIRNSILIKGDIDPAVVYTVVFSKRSLFVSNAITPVVVATNDIPDDGNNTTDHETNNDQGNNSDTGNNDTATNPNDPGEIVQIANDFETAFANKATVTSIRVKKTEDVSIPDEITTVQNLLSFSMTMGELTSINPKLYEIKGLKTLNLASNKITEIPAGISKLTNLRKLYIANNPITNIPDELLTMTSLKTIMISNTKVPEARIQELKKALPECKVMFSPPNGANIPWEKATEMAPSMGKNGKGQYLKVSSAQFFDENNAIGVGNSEWIVGKTSNGGRTWVQMKRAGYLFGNMGSFADIHFLNENEGWLVGKSGIFYTSNGGETITQQLDQAVFSIHFLDDKRGVARGSNDVFYTTDGGANWKTLVTNSNFEFYKRGFFLNENTIVLGAVTSNKSSVYLVNISGSQPKIDLVYTDAENEAWKKRFATKIYFTDTQTGYIFGTKGLLLKTTDAGHSWSQYDNSEFNSIIFSDAEFIDTQNGWAIGYYSEKSENPGVILRTVNGGKTWFNKKSTSTKIRGLEGVEIVDENNIFFIGDGVHKRN